MPMTFETACAYFLVKNYQKWGAPVALHAWDDWETLGDRLGNRLGCHIWHPGHWDTFWRRSIEMSTPHHTDLLTLCDALQSAGIWLSFNGDDSLVVGPTALVQQHPTLLEGVRAHKAALLRLLEDSLAHSLFGEKNDDARFEREDCPDCHQPCLIVLGPRRLGVHRVPDGKSVCPGSDRAQTITADVILGPFVADRCVVRAESSLSWYAIRGALEGWCAERSFLLPPRPFVFAWFDTHFSRQGTEDCPAWVGLTLTLPEWGLDDEPVAIAPPAVVLPQSRKKLVLKVTKPKAPTTQSSLFPAEVAP
jgi:hypothetical protein